MAEQGIYREAALDRLSSPDRLDQGLSIVGRGTWLVLSALGVLAIGGLFWGAILMVPVTVSGQGILLAPGGVLDVSSAWPGRVMSFTVHVGDKVKAGEVIAQLDQPEVHQDLVSAQGEYRDAVEEHTRILAFQKQRGPIFRASADQRRQAFLDDIAALDRELGWLHEKAAADEQLAAKKLTTSEKILDTRINIAKTEDQQAQARNGLRNLDVEATKGETDDARELLTSELKVGTAERKMHLLQERLDRESAVVSPYSGTVVELKVNPGEMVERTGALFSLEPLEAMPASADKVTTGPLYAVIYVPPNDGKKIHPGMVVRVSPSTVKREEFGFIEGVVRQVAEVPSTMEGMNRVLKNKQLVQTLAKDGAPFEVVIDLLADPSAPSGYKWSSKPGKAVTINGGTLATADIETKSMPILSLIVPPLRQLLTRS